MAEDPNKPAPRQGILDVIRNHPIGAFIIALGIWVWNTGWNFVQSWSSFNNKETIPEFLARKGWWGLIWQLPWRHIFMEMVVIGIFLTIIIALKRKAAPDAKLSSKLPRRDPLEDRILLAMLERSFDEDQLREYFDGIHDQRITHHIESLLGAKLIQQEKLTAWPRKTFHTISANGRKYLVDWKLMPASRLPRQDIPALEKRILNVLSLGQCQNEDLAIRATIKLSELEKHINSLLAQKFIRNTGTYCVYWEITDAGRKRLSESSK